MDNMMRWNGAEINGKQKQNDNQRLTAFNISDVNCVNWRKLKDIQASFASLGNCVPGPSGGLYRFNDIYSWTWQFPAAEELDIALLSGSNGWKF